MDESVLDSWRRRSAPARLSRTSDRPDSRCHLHPRYHYQRRRDYVHLNVDHILDYVDLYHPTYYDDHSTAFGPGP